MPVPARQRPTSTLPVNVESIGPKHDQQIHSLPATTKPPTEYSDRRVRFPRELVKLAQSAQKLAAAHGGYDCLNALFVGAVFREVQRIEAELNDNRPLATAVTPEGARYRYGMPTGRI